MIDLVWAKGVSAKASKLRKQPQWGSYSYDDASTKRLGGFLYRLIRPGPFPFPINALHQGKGYIGFLSRNSNNRSESFSGSPGTYLDANRLATLKLRLLSEDPRGD